ncbi:exo-alpha-sialidase [Massilia sp. PAMC28688]|uniref:exo-alpha-sialidase n=1 Tax=Massilia sp. PAMC28688 TaxID=2861283 RepID=UPI001C639F44|nr:sialidase family protein [Massilia sp. PAMC28688]QYF94852.1 exo-alpha-sialidase [Massilia sp. PAMC28688]
MPGLMQGRGKALLLSIAILITAGAAAVEAWRWSHPTMHRATPAVSVGGQAVDVELKELSRSLIPMPPDTPSAHASTLATLPGEHMLAFWWAGSRESGPNVKVYASRWSGSSWSAAWEVASRDSLARELGFGVRRIGNPVAWTDHRGTIHLYVVATGLGGWAASRIVHLSSTSEGARFAVRRVLPLSPMFNTSALVRTSPVGLTDGGWWLPAYFEMGIKYPMMISFDPEGEPKWFARIGESDSTLQPTIAAISASEVRAWMRDASDDKRVQQALSRDGGENWEDLPALDLPNDNTSLATVRLASGKFLMLHNHVVAGGSSRSILRLSSSSDAHTWEHVVDIAKGSAGDEFSYPTLQQVGDELHVTYTHQRQAIAHHRFRIHSSASP